MARNSKHGTRKRYRSGCACDKCKQANALWIREYYHQHREEILHKLRDRRAVRRLVNEEIAKSERRVKKRMEYDAAVTTLFPNLVRKYVAR